MLGWPPFTGPACASSEPSENRFLGFSAGQCVVFVHRFVPRCNGRSQKTQQIRVFVPFKKLRPALGKGIHGFAFSMIYAQLGGLHRFCTDRDLAAQTWALAAISASLRWPSSFNARCLRVQRAVLIASGSITSRNGNLLKSVSRVQIRKIPCSRMRMAVCVSLRSGLPSPRKGFRERTLHHQDHAGRLRRRTHRMRALGLSSVRCRSFWTMRSSISTPGTR